jgi:hypothetical protein
MDDKRLFITERWGDAEWAVLGLGSILNVNQAVRRPEALEFIGYSPELVRRLLVH